MLMLASQLIGHVLWSSPICPILIRVGFLNYTIIIITFFIIFHSYVVLIINYRKKNRSTQFFSCIEVNNLLYSVCAAALRVKCVNTYCLHYSIISYSSINISWFMTDFQKYNGWQERTWRRGGILCREGPWPTCKKWKGNFSLLSLIIVFQYLFSNAK